MRKGRKLVQATKITIDGINFDSRLEGYMYGLLKSSGLAFEYEGQSFEVLKPFYFSKDFYQVYRKEYNNRGNKKVLGIKYTPDFIVKHKDMVFVIETKGRPNELFPMRMKLFKSYLVENKLNWSIYIPTNQLQCVETIKLIQNEIKAKK